MFTDNNRNKHFDENSGCKISTGLNEKNPHQMFHNRYKNSDKYVIVIILTEAISSVNKSKKRNENRLNLYLVDYKHFSLFCL